MLHVRGAPSKRPHSTHTQGDVRHIGGFQQQLQESLFHAGITVVEVVDGEKLLHVLTELEMS